MWNSGALLINYEHLNGNSIFGQINKETEGSARDRTRIRKWTVGH